VPRFSANISTLFTEAPFLERIELARKSGFQGIEFQFPYEQDPIITKQALDHAELPLVLFNFPGGDFRSGGQGNVAVPGREPEFAAEIEQAHYYAEILRPINVNILSGRPDPGLNKLECFDSLRSNIQLALAAFSDLPSKLIIEAINTIDVPGFFLSEVQQVAELISNLETSSVGIQFDIYHAQMMGLNIESEISVYFSRIAHFQFADAPGRHEPGTGSIDFKKIFNQIDQLGFKGFVGAEYLPSDTTGSSLHWLTP